MLRPLPQQNRKGATVVEAAIVLPVVLFIVLFIIVGGLGVMRYHRVAHLAREAARYASVHGGTYASEKASAISAGTLPNVNGTHLVNNIVKGNASGLDTTQLSATITMNTAAGTFGWDQTATSQNNGRAITSGSVTNTVRVTVTYNWVPELNLTGPIQLKSTALMPMSY